MIDGHRDRTQQTGRPTMPSTEESQTIEDQLRAFRRRCLLFAFPLLLFAVPAIGILLASSESFVDVDSIVERSDAEQFLVGFAYNEHNYGYLKYRRLTTLPKQSVVALGSSRVLGFREEMFTGSFYNAGYTIVSPWDFRSFPELVPDSQLPEVVILGLDQFMFNAANNRQRQPKESTAWTSKPRDDLHSALQLIPDVYKDLVRGRIAIGAVLTNATGSASENETRTVGLNGLNNDRGFRNDGLFVYGSQAKLLLDDDSNARDYEFAHTLARVNRKSRLFNPGGAVDESAVDEIGRVLDYCRERAVQVVAFLPPYADAVWQAMQDSGDFEYTLKIESALRERFGRYGFELHAFHCMSDCGSSDQEAIDGFHAGEVTYLKMVIQMLQRGSALNQYADLNQLQNDVLQVVDRYTPYPEPHGAVRRLAVGGTVGVVR